MEEFEKKKRESGQSLIVVTMLIVIVMGFAGLTIDVGRLYLTRQELQNYTDAATLAGARELPYGSEGASVIKNKLDEATYQALVTYARNIGVDPSTIPSPVGGGYSYTPAWNPSGTNTNLKYSYDMAHVVGGKTVIDHVAVTVMFTDAETQQRDLPKERVMAVEASREVDMIFGGLLGPPLATAERLGGAYKGVFEVQWKFYTRADVHGTPIYHVDRDGIEKVYTVSKDGYIYALDAWGEDADPGRTYAYWKFKVLGSPPWGERYLCYPYTGMYSCEPTGQSEYNAPYAIISSPKVMPSISLTPQCSAQHTTCFDFEALNAVDNGDGTTTLSYKVCSIAGGSCTAALSNIAFSLPSGVVPSWPADGGTYQGFKSYNVENTTNNPFYSIKYETIGEGIKNGQCDTFRYIIPTSQAHYSIQIRAKAGTPTYDASFGPNCSFWLTTDNNYDLTFFASYPLSDDSNRGRLYALNATDGSLVWVRYVGQRKYHLGSYGYNSSGALYIDSAPAFSPDGAVVYYASRDGNLYAFNVADGSNVWTTDCDGAGPGESCFAMTGGTISTPVVHPVTGVIYVATSKKKDGSGTGVPKTDRGVIHAINPDGTQKWVWYPNRTGQGFNSTPVLWPPSNPTALYIGSRDKYLYKLNISGSTASQTWEYIPPNLLVAPDGTSGNPQSAISATPAVADEGGSLYLYFSTEYGAGYKIKDNGSSVSGPPTAGTWGVWLGYDIDPTAGPPGGGTGSNIRRGAYISPALAQDFVYFGTVTEWDLQCAFQAVRRSDGLIFQSFVMNNDTHSSLRVAPNGWIYYASCDNYTYGVDTNPESLDSRLVR